MRCFATRVVVAIRPSNPTQTSAAAAAATTTTTTTTTTGTCSARQRFKEIPVHSSILEYIRSIGVGIAPRRTVKQRNQPPVGSGHDTRRPRGRASARTNRLRQSWHEKRTSVTSESVSKPPLSSLPLHYSCLPPPPFGPNSSPVQMIASVGPESVKLHNTVSVPGTYHTSRHTLSSSSIAASSSTATTKPTSTDPVVSVNRKDFPKNDAGIAEIALAGRSNVGKSTLLNALLYGNRDPSAVPPVRHRQRGRVPPNVKLLKGIKAAMSSKPGETRRISFYKLQHVSKPTSTSTTAAGANVTTKVTDRFIESRRLHLVDLPGYGFAYAKESDAAAYRALMADYILHRGKTLKRVLVLLDARHGMKQADFDFFNLLQQQKQIPSEETPLGQRRDITDGTIPPIQLVLTKCDLVEQVDLARRVAQVRQQLSDILRREPSQLPIMLVSARPGVGYNNVDRHTSRALGGVLELQKELSALALPKQSRSNRTIGSA